MWVDEWKLKIYPQDNGDMGNRTAIKGLNCILEVDAS